MYKFIGKIPKMYRLCHYAGTNIRIIQVSVRQFATPQPLCPPNPQKPPKKASTGTAYTIGALTLIGIGTIGYAKYDPEFRSWLKENVPYSNDFIAFIFQEEKSVGESLTDWATSTKRTIGDSIASGLQDPKKKLKDIKDEAKEYIPPRPVFPSLIKPEQKDKKFEEIRAIDEGKSGVEIVKEKPKKAEITDPTHPKNLADLEIKICDSAKSAIECYKKAKMALRDYNNDVETVIETSVDKLDQQIWITLKKKKEIKDCFVKEAEDHVSETKKKLNRLKEYIRYKEFHGTEDQKAAIERTMARYMDDIKRAQTDYENEKHLAALTDKYWTKVSAARCHFIEELEVLFPGIDVSKKKLTMNQSNLDLFLLHAFAHVLYYQKELHRIQTVGSDRLHTALQKLAQNDPDFDVVQAYIEDELEKEKRNLALEYQRKCLSLRQESERELRHRLKCQAEAHQDHLNDALIMREQELEREFSRKLDHEIALEQSKYKIQLASMVGRMKGMRTAIKERIEQDKIAQKSQVLWSACQALHRAVRNSQPGISLKEQMKPLQHEISAIKNAAADSDELVQVVLNGIPEEALTRGVFPEDAIRERFLKVERIARRVALVPENGGRLPLYVLSFIQSILFVPAANPIPKMELLDEETDFCSLNTYDILQRARYYLDRGNYAQTLRYMNLLKGASKRIACDWMKETRILLETQQAAETLMAHAVAGGLAY